MDNEKVVFNIIGDEKKQALIQELCKNGTIEVTDSDGMEPNVGEYLDIKRTLLEIDKIIVELSSQLMPLRGVQIKLQEWRSEKIKISRNEEYAKTIADVYDKVKEANISMMQVMSYLGEDVGNIFKVLCPDELGGCSRIEDIEKIKETESSASIVK